MPSYNTVVIQADNSYSSSSAVPNSSSDSYPMSSAASSYTASSSSSSRQSYISSTTSHSRSASRSAQISRSATKPAQVIGELPYGRQEFVYTGRPQGGNPNGGPKRYEDGYMRVTTKSSVVHNSGGLSTGVNPVLLSPEFGNGQEHEKHCREKSRYSDNQGLCFCESGN